MQDLREEVRELKQMNEQQEIVIAELLHCLPEENMSSNDFRGKIIWDGQLSLFFLR